MVPLHFASNVAECLFIVLHLKRVNSEFFYSIKLFYSKNVVGKLREKISLTGKVYAEQTREARFSRPHKWK